MDKTDDDVLLDAVRLAVGVSVRAADQLGDLSPVQLRALTVLQERPGANLAQLADALGVTVSTASRLVDRLITGRLATRRPSPQTRREITLSLTRTGRTTLQRYDRLRLEALRSCIRYSGGDVAQTLVAVLREVIAAAPGLSESPPPD